MREKSPIALLGRLIAPYRGLGPSLWSMFVATMVNRFGDFVGAFLALYLSRILGYEATRAGLAVSLAFAASALGALVSGRVADAIGRKRTLVICQASTAIFNLAMSFLFRMSWSPWLIVAGSFFRGAARPLIGAVLTDLAPAGRRKEVFGLQYWSINVGVAFGPIVAAFLFDRALPWLFRGDAICSMASACLIALRVRVSRAAQESSLERPDERGALGAFLARPILLAFASLSLLSSLTYSQTNFSLPLTVSTALGDGGPRFYGLLISLNAVMVLLFSIPIARLLRAKSPLWCMAVSGLLFVAGFGMLGVSAGRAWLAISTAVWTLGEIVNSVNMGVFLAKHSPANWRGSFQSFLGLFSQGGHALGPLLAGPIIAVGSAGAGGAGRAGVGLLWAATATVCALWAAGAVAVDRWDRRTGVES